MAVWKEAISREAVERAAFTAVGGSAISRAGGGGGPHLQRLERRMLSPGRR